MLSLERYWMGRDKEYPPTDEQIDNAEILLEKIALLEEDLDVEFIMTSGYRPEEMIEKHLLPGCAHDAHSQCSGIDLFDPELEISKRLTEDPQLLVDVGLWMESPVSAKNHLHLQSYPPHSGKRIFLA